MHDSNVPETASPAPLSPVATEQHGVSRLLSIRTLLHRKKLCAVVLSIAALVRAAGSVEPDPSIEPEAFDQPSRKKIPTPDRPLEEIFAALRHPEDVTRFLNEQTHYRKPESIGAFFARFEQQPEDFLAETFPAEQCESEADAGKPGGPCNNYVRFNGDWHRFWGRKSYIVRLMPKFGPQWDLRNCHEVIVVPIENGYLIHNNASHKIVEAESIHTALASEFPDMQPFPGIGGIVPYVRTRNKNWFARIVHTSGINLPDVATNPDLTVPQRPVELVKE